MIENAGNQNINRLHQIVLIASTVVASWLGMQAVHEGGHALGAALTGGKVSRVVLDPFTISRTDLSLNPQPLVTVWAGPIFGVIAPFFVWMVIAFVKSPIAFLFRFFAGFCLIANGLYIGVGSFEGIGDCGEMLRNGAKYWHLWLFGIATVPLGLILWHQQGSAFGLGRSPSPINKKATLTSLFASVALYVNGMFLRER